MIMVRITKDSKLCIVRDLSNGYTTAATYYGDVNRCGLVVVKKPDGTLGVRSIIEVITDEDLVENYIVSGDVHCEVIGVVDTSDYNEAMYREDHREELMSKMRERAEQIEEDLYYQYLAGQDEEFAKLYDEYKQYL